jgi:hypothetical protein
MSLYFYPSFILAEETSSRLAASKSITVTANSSDDAKATNAFQPHSCMCSEAHQARSAHDCALTMFCVNGELQWHHLCLEFRMLFLEGASFGENSAEHESGKASHL